MNLPLKRKIKALFLTVAVVFSCVILPMNVHASGNPIRGIDVSKWNDCIDWTAVKNSGIEFAIIRDGYGGDPGYWDAQTDIRFKQNYEGAKAAGLKVGTYHFCYAVDAETASQEADECIYILRKYHCRLDYPVAYDIEKNGSYDPTQFSSQTIGDIVDTFCSKIQKAGYKAAVYASKSFLEDKFTDPRVSRYDTWVAQYNGRSSTSYSRNYTMWQYSSTGKVSGISGDCDLDYSYLDYSWMTPQTFECDTSSYSFGPYRTYTYEIMTMDANTPIVKSSNTNAVSVSYQKKVSEGYYFTITNRGPGTATITTTSSNGRHSVSFEATGSNAVSTYRCDTTEPYTFKGNSYTYKICTASSAVPTAESSNSNFVKVTYTGPVRDGYLYRIDNVGTGDAAIKTTSADGKWYSSFIAHGSGGSISCDTSSYTFSNTSTYYYKIDTNATTAPVAHSSDSSKVAVSFSKKLSEGSYLYRIDNEGPGKAIITTTAANGVSISFPAYGMAGTMECDTAYYKFKTNQTYYYKIDTNFPFVPTAYSSDPSKVAVSFSRNLSDSSYLFRLDNMGTGDAVITTKAANGDSNTFHAYGTAFQEFSSDTPYNFTMEKGSAYQYKFTVADGVDYKFVCAGTSTLQPVYLQKIGNFYYYKVAATEKGCVGIYASFGNTYRRVGIVTVV
mgnify:FL=1